jgi:rSAM/selenodomain-associated transferase 1
MPTFSSTLAFCGVAVMAKASQPGLTKTRLCPPLTFEEAANFNTAFLKDIAENLVAASARTSLAGTMAFGPPRSEAFFRQHLPGDIALHEVWRADFGDCLREAMRRQFAAGHRAACVLNSDSPTLPIALLAEMVDVLSRPGDRAVLGPSTDGGYYLLASKTLHPHLFTGVAWSTEAVFAQTLERASEMGLPVHILPEWYDIDDAAALRLLAEELLAGKRFSTSLQSSPAPHSTALLKTMFQAANLGGRLDRFLADGVPKPLREAAA